MKKFIYKAALFLVFLILPLSIFFYINKQFIAAYQVSNSYSFNEKIKWLPTPHQIDIMAIGSSMSLNNISSNEIINGFNTKKYINFSSWGLKIKNIENLTPLINTLYKPKSVLCVSNIMDFNTPSITYNNNKIAYEINNKRNIYPFLFKKYYYDHTNQNKVNYLKNNLYTSLKFDLFGGVPFSPNNFHKIDFRWKLQHSDKKVSEINYDALLNLSKYLDKNNIQFIFVQPPIRQSLQTLVYYSYINKHIKKVRSLIEPNGAIVIDLSSKKYPDSFFVDSTHLNQTGADVFTKNFITEYKKMSFKYE